MDVLSDTLRVVRLTGSVFLNAKLISPWAIMAATPAELAEYLHLPSDCIALFHILVHGSGWFSVRGRPPMLMRAGDAILLPHCPPHLMSSGHDAAPIPMLSTMPPLPPEGFVEIGGSGLGETSQFICGFLHCDQRFNPLLGALPEVIVVHPSNGDADNQEVELSGERALVSSAVLPVQTGDFLETTLRHTIEEALGERPGSSDMLARLSELLFVEMVRRYMQRLPPAQHGWLAGVRDPIVGQVLRLLHTLPEHPWTVEALADAVSISRSTLAQRFTALVGETPMRYLAIWRMQLAKYLLKHTNLSLIEVAERVGYDSDVAFSHAFKRHVGQPPATWRVIGDSQ